MQEFGNKLHFNNNFFEIEKIYDHIRLYQIGDLFCQSGSVIEEHAQICYELTYAVSGTGTVYVNDIPLDIQPNQIHLSLPGDKHSIVSDTISPLRYFFIGFKLNIDHPLYQRYRSLETALKAPSSRIVNDNYSLSSLIVNCLSEFNNSRLIKDTQLSDLIIQSNLNLLLSYIIRLFTQRNKQAYAPITSNSETLVYTIINYIDDNLTNIRHLYEIPQQFGYSYSHVSHLFSKFLGCTLEKYFFGKKMEKAAELIQNSELTITQIAERLGYSSIHALNHAFKRQFNCSPQNFRSKKF